MADGTDLHATGGGRPSGVGPSVVVERDVGEPIDLDSWVRAYVAMALELEGIKPRVAPPVSASIGLG